MKRLLTFAIVASVVLAGTIFLWLHFYEIHVRYRLTVEVQDGGQIRTGSSVIDLVYPRAPEGIDGIAVGRHVIAGYAPTVDLGKKGMLFLTFRSTDRSSSQWIERNKQIVCPFDDVGCLPFAAYDKLGTTIGIAAVEQKVALDDLFSQRGPREVPFIVLPELLRLADIHDVNTRRSVLPNGLSGSFGPGVALKRVIVQLTDDPITAVPEIWPQWLKEKQQSAAFGGYDRR
jgi:hypothetical protein